MFFGENRVFRPKMTSFKKENHAFFTLWRNSRFLKSHYFPKDDVIGENHAFFKNTLF